MIGSTAQDTSVRAPLGQVYIGNDVVVKEFTTISAPKSMKGVTRIGDRSFLMHFSHIGHDAHLEHDVVLTNHAQVGGHAHIEHHVYLMANTGVHQRCRIGQYTALAPHSGARQDLPPFSMFIGRPGKFAGLNTFLLRREGFTSETISALKTATTWFYRDKLPTTEFAERCAEQPWSNTPAVVALLNFITNSARGISRQRITE
jgi:UDP-N-acetylglucosamine acyltransferase